MTSLVILPGKQTSLVILTCQNTHKQTAPKPKTAPSDLSSGAVLCVYEYEGSMLIK